MVYRWVNFSTRVAVRRLIHYMVSSRERKEEQEEEGGGKTKSSVEGGVLHKMVVVSSTSEADSAMSQVLLVWINKEKLID